MNEQHQQNREKLQRCFTQLQDMGIVSKSKMFKFYKTVSSAFSELDKEFVNCRRTRKITTKYTELEKKLDECVTVFEHYAVLAALTY